MYCTSDPDSGRRITAWQGSTFAAAGVGPLATRTIALLPLAITDRRMEYCLQLAASNMTPYLQQRRQSFDATRWRNVAPQADFFLVSCESPGHASTMEQTAGFLSVRDAPDYPNALHIGDIQLEAALCGHGIGSAVLAQVDTLARSRGRSEITLNVFRENPAVRLYERSGYQRIDTDLLSGKYKMRKTLRTAFEQRQMTNDDC